MVGTIFGWNLIQHGRACFKFKLSGALQIKKQMAKLQNSTSIYEFLCFPCFRRRLQSMNFYVSHVFREGNQCADGLANIGLSVN